MQQDMHDQQWSDEPGTALGARIPCGPSAAVRGPACPVECRNPGFVLSCQHAPDCEVPLRVVGQSLQCDWNTAGCDRLRLLRPFS